jgi:hypothetical protein
MGAIWPKTGGGWQKWVKIWGETGAIWPKQVVVGENG